METKQQQPAKVRGGVDLSEKALSRPGSAQTLKALFESDGIKQRIAAVLPKHMSPDRMLKVALSAVLKTPKLLECTQMSLLQALVQLGELGLEPGGALGLAYLVPYKQTCQAIIGYRGYIELARRSGRLESVVARVVHEKDSLLLRFGLDEKLDHQPNTDGDPGPARFVYCVAFFKGGGHHLEVMSIAEVEKIRARSKAGQDGPWVTDYEEMCKKTVVRRAAKYWPLSPELADAMALDDEQFVDGEVTSRDRVAGHRMPVAPGKPKADESVVLDFPSGKESPSEAPAHDPETGEVLEGESAAPSPATSTEPPTDKIDNLLWRISRASAVELSALTRETSGLPKDEPRRIEVSQAIQARRKEVSQ